jgi:hypothetical protein
MIAGMKEPQSLALRLLILFVIGTFATALNLTIKLQVTIGFSWWTLGRAPHSWLGWPTYALEATAIVVVGLWAGYRGMGPSKAPPSINGLIILSSVSSIFGLIVYSFMSPVTDFRITDDLRPFYSQLSFSLVAEALAEFTASMGIGAIAGRFLAIDNSRLREN